MRQTESMMKACDPKSLTAGQLMEDAVVTCTPRTDGLALGRMLTERNIGSLPVVEDDSTLVGLVSEYDLLQAMIEERDLRKITAADLMTRQVLTVTEDRSLEYLANLFQDRYVTRLPVVRNQKLVGIVARRDLVFGYMKALQYWS
ncbi:MAG: CBS domain-containing protein [Nitrospirae bacterium]|nr:MAG: CBS domain-containing protein [Nitrospirota bacterium]